MSTRSRIQAVEQTVAFEDSTAGSSPSGLAVLVLSSAIQNGRRVLLRYRSSREEVTERAFDPYGIAYHKGFWYTIGYCHLREGQRLFRLDRITHIETTSETFPPRVYFPALEAVQQALASVPRVWQVEVWLETTLSEAQRQTRLPKSVFSSRKWGGLLAHRCRRSAVDGSPRHAFHCPSPPELRDVLRQHARTLVSYAERMET